MVKPTLKMAIVLFISQARTRVFFLFCFAFCCFFSGGWGGAYGGKVPSAFQDKKGEEGASLQMFAHR